MSTEIGLILEAARNRGSSKAFWYTAGSTRRCVSQSAARHASHAACRAFIPLAKNIDAPPTNEFPRTDPEELAKRQVRLRARTHRPV